MTMPRPAHAPVLHDGRAPWSQEQLALATDRFAAALKQAGATRLATLLDNGPAWVVADQACIARGLVHLPLPGFFTPAQWQHALASTGVDALLLPRVAVPTLQGLLRSAGVQGELSTTPIDIAGQALALLRWQAVEVALPPGTATITFTSGTTGAPKGVCLSHAGMKAVADGVATALDPLGLRRHLCALPLAVLLENVAGLMAPLARGVTCYVLPMAEIGLKGSSSFDPSMLQAIVARHEIESLILLPQMLRGWTLWLQARGERAPACLRFVAVGGAAVGARTLEDARGVGLPAYEGYGLSEGGSVQTLNLPGADRPGSAGRALPHAFLRTRADGEIEVRGSGFIGYVGESAARADDWWPTGDLGEVDAQGFLQVRGRHKHVLITAYGRNVSPEWVETALRSEPGVAQAVVLGDGQPSLSAVLWPLAGGESEATVAASLDAAVARANAQLPDYARIGHWVRGHAPFDAASGMATANGRPRRDAVAALHATALGLDTMGDVAATSGSAPDDAAAVVSPATRSTGPTAPASFYAELLTRTAGDRTALTAVPIIQGCLQRGEVSLPSYLAFLREAFHHVRHTVPLLRACKAALPAHHAWLEPALDEYIEEEAGHDEWILDDIAACDPGGRDAAEAVRREQAGAATELMVAYAYDTIARVNPLAFFGMVHVLEGTSVALALMAADRIQEHLGLPDAGFSYLRSHGTLDREHTSHFALLMDAITDPADQDAIVHAARMFYRLYADVFRSLPLPHATQAAPRAATTAATHEELHA